MPWGCDISIHITEDAFKRMMELWEKALSFAK